MTDSSLQRVVLAREAAPATIRPAAGIAKGKIFDTARPRFGV